MVPEISYKGFRKGINKLNKKIQQEIKERIAPHSTQNENVWK